MTNWTITIKQAGLNPTSETLCHWIWQRLKPHLAELIESRSAKPRLGLSISGRPFFSTKLKKISEKGCAVSKFCSICWRVCYTHPINDIFIAVM